VKLDAQIINHNYVTRMVVFSIFLFKNYRKEEAVYFQMINNFLKKKIGYKIDLSIECGPKLALEDSRDILIENILNDDDDFDHMNLVVATFKTALKEVNMQIDLNKEDKYENYLYS
jgi:hypothetical protein